MLLKFIKLEIVIFIATLSNCGANSKEEQKRQFLTTFEPSENENCSGKLLHNITDLKDFSYKEETLEVVANGLWRISSLGDDGYWFNSYVSGVGHDICEKLWLTFGTKRVKVERFGDPYQQAKELNLYTGPYFRGGNTRVKDSLSFSSPLKVESWHFTGNYSWTFYSEKDFKGKSACLLAKLDGNDWGITFEGINTKLAIVGSVMAGCKDETDSKSSISSNSSNERVKNFGIIMIFLLAVFSTSIH